MLQILREAPEHPAVKYNSKYFENLFKVANITVLRIAQDLRDLNLIETKHQQYVLKEGFDEWDEMFDKDAKNQIVLIAGIKGLHQQYKDTPLLDNIEKLFYLFEPKSAKSSGLLSSARIAVPPQMEFNIKENNWDKILRAMEQNKKIKARYVAPWYKPEKMKFRERFGHIRFYLIMEPFIFLHIVNITVKNIFMILINLKASQLQMKSSNFLKTSILQNAVRGGRLGAFSSDKVEKYEIEVSGFASYWIKDHKWADDQTFEELDEEDVIIRFSSCQYAKVKELVLSLGSGAKPLAPKRLVNEWKKEVTAMYENMNR